MTRIKEPSAGIQQTQIEYKSPASRILRSLRQGYDNARLKVEKKAEEITRLRGKLRDIQESRETWKMEAKKNEARKEELERENSKLQEELKKRFSNY